MENKKLLDYEGLKRYNTKVQELLSEKQENLVSGTNIKTINGQSVLGDGNIEIKSEVTITSITDEEIGNLFEPGILETKYVSQEVIQEAISTEY